MTSGPSRPALARDAFRARTPSTIRLMEASSSNAGMTTETVGAIFVSTIPDGADWTMGGNSGWASSQIDPARCLLRPVANLLDDPRGRSRDDRVRRNLSCHHRAGCDHRPPPDAHAIRE